MYGVRCAIRFLVPYQIEMETFHKKCELGPHNVKSKKHNKNHTHTHIVGHISRTAGPGTSIRGVNPRSHGGGCAAKTASQKSTSYSCSRRTWRARSA
jgi:hypothetical protein